MRNVEVDRRIEVEIETDLSGSIYLCSFAWFYILLANASPQVDSKSQSQVKLVVIRYELFCSHIKRPRAGQKHDRKVTF